MLQVHNRPCSVKDDIKQMTSKIVKAGPCVTVTQLPHKKIVLPGINPIVLSN